MPLTIYNGDKLSAAISVLGDELGCTAIGFPRKDQSITLQKVIQQLGVIDIESFELAFIRAMNDILLIQMTLIHLLII